ncbi:hypothetical protein GCM10009753_40390 [Streptantibioticus ferralitis]
MLATVGLPGAALAGAAAASKEPSVPATTAAASGRLVERARDRVMKSPVFLSACVMEQCRVGNGKASGDR